MKIFGHYAGLLVLSILLISGCRGEQYFEITGQAQGGMYNVKIGIPYNVDVLKLKHGIDSILLCVERSVSGYREGSLLQRFNNGDTIMDDGSPEYAIFKAMTEFGDSLYITTNGAVDTRSAALFDIWGFGFREGKLPREHQISSAMSDRSKMNFNAVAQGYSCDLVASYLIDNGIRNMLVNVGGEMFCLGKNRKGENWQVGIDRPVDGNDTPGANLSAIFEVPTGVTLADGRISNGCGVVTSGNYRKFYIHNGIKYSHTIDPRTGRPVQHNLLSATILAPTSALADGLATYCMVIGMEKAQEFILSRPDLEACLISSDSLWTSPGFKISDRFNGGQ